MKSMTAAEQSALSGAPVTVERVTTNGSRISAYLDLTKPRITVLVVLSALAGFAMGSQSGIDYLGLLHTAVGIALLASGIGALNQYIERDLDALMRRTQLRPLPTGRLSPLGALSFGIALCVFAEFYLAYFLNPLTAFFGFIALGSYLFLYTPLKTRTLWCTFVGAFPGALPPLLGWTAARNEVGIEAIVLFGILFHWQFTHLHAIATMYREDYERAGIRMLPVVEVDGRRTAREIVLYTMALVPVSLLPVVLKLSGPLYLVGAVVLGLLFLYAAITAARSKSKTSARYLLRASVLYLPLLLLLMILNRS